MNPEFGDSEESVRCAESCFDALDGLFACCKQPFFLLALIEILYPLESSFVVLSDTFTIELGFAGFCISALESLHFCHLFKPPH